MSAHLGLQVVCSDFFGGWNQCAIFVVKRSFDATVEEEGDVGIFFCLGNPQLVHPSVCNNFAENFGITFGVISDRQVKGLIVLRQADES